MALAPCHMSPEATCILPAIHELYCMIDLATARVAPCLKAKLSAVLGFTLMQEAVADRCDLQQVGAASKKISRCKHPPVIFLYPPKAPFPLKAHVHMVSPGFEIGKNQPAQISSLLWMDEILHRQSKHETPLFVGMYRGINIPGFSWVVRNGFRPSTVCPPQVHQLQKGFRGREAQNRRAVLSFSQQTNQPFFGSAASFW